MKKEFKRNPWTMLCAVLSGKILKNIKKGMDYEGCGGAMFLGLSKTVVKGHGNSKAKGFAVCIEQAANAVRGDMVNKIKTLCKDPNLLKKLLPVVGKISRAVAACAMMPKKWNRERVLAWAKVYSYSFK